MIDALRDIQQKLSRGAYQNEEHVRLNLVTRLLQELGWDIWDPREVFPEFRVVPNEDATKVDLALFMNDAPSVYIEIKACGKIAGCLKEVEEQVRDYNRNNDAIFSVITDGQEWRLYYALTPGEFSQKLFKVVNLASGDLAEVERTLKTFLTKEEIKSGRAKEEAENCLQVNRRQRVINECLPEARRLVQEPPYPTLPECLVELMRKKGYTITRDEAISFIRIAGGAAGQSPPVPEPGRNLPNEVSQLIRKLSPDNPGNVRFTKVLEGRLGSASATNWNELVALGVKLALIERRIPLQDLKDRGLPLVEGNRGDGGFSLIPGTNVSYRNLSASDCAPKVVTIAKLLREPLYVKVRWVKVHPWRARSECWSGSHRFPESQEPFAEYVAQR
jgi:hypothetical protein